MFQRVLDRQGGLFAVGREIEDRPVPNLSVLAERFTQEVSDVRFAVFRSVLASVDEHSGDIIRLPSVQCNTYIRLRSGYISAPKNDRNHLQRNA